jgi:1-acyl-sn-glycerol-3-phosphate acyltransferase
MTCPELIGVSFIRSAHVDPKEFLFVMVTMGWLLAAAAPAWAAWFAWRRGHALREADWGASWLNALDGINRAFCRRYHRMNPVRLPLPEHGGAIVVANHVSGLDPLLLIAASRRPLRFLIAREEYERFGLRWLFRAVGCIPVDRRERPERALRLALRALHEGEVVALFPQGGIHLAEVPARLKGGAVRLAQKSRCLVYPAHIDGVRGAGMTLPAVVLRSRAHVRVFPPIACGATEQQQCLDQISRLLHKTLWGDLHGG